MSRSLKPGERIRVTVRNRMACYQPGDKGTVLGTVRPHDGGSPFCLVAMDKDAPAGAGVLFNADEIEPDV
jgi:hypothetical protein